MRFTSYALTLQRVQNNSTHGISDVDCLFSLMYIESILLSTLNLIVYIASPPRRQEPYS
jgi:hypothetical protein